MKEKEPLQATLEKYGAEGAILRVNAPVTCHVGSSAGPFAHNMLPYHNGGQWVINVTPTRESTHIVEIRQDGEPLAFISFRWTQDGPVPIHMDNIAITHTFPKEKSEHN